MEGGGPGPISGWQSISVYIIGVARMHLVVRRERVWKRWQDGWGWHFRKN